MVSASATQRTTSESFELTLWPNLPDDTYDVLVLFIPQYW